jgi:hypothetical protein
MVSSTATTANRFPPSTGTEASASAAAPSAGERRSMSPAATTVSSVAASRAPSPTQRLRRVRRDERRAGCQVARCVTSAANDRPATIQEAHSRPRVAAKATDVVAAVSSEARTKKRGAKRSPCRLRPAKDCTTRPTPVVSNPNRAVTRLACRPTTASPSAPSTTAATGSPTATRIATTTAAAKAAEAVRTAQREARSPAGRATAMAAAATAGRTGTTIKKVSGSVIWTEAPYAVKRGTVIRSSGAVPVAARP